MMTALGSSAFGVDECVRKHGSSCLLALQKILQMKSRIRNKCTSRNCEVPLGSWQLMKSKENLIDVPQENYDTLPCQVQRGESVLRILAAIIST